MLSWEKLLTQTRRKDLYEEGKSVDTGVGRTEFERDYDRILFATPTRRLADKTQVFPMEQHDSIRTRLTHSYEVSNLARSIGIKLAFEHAEKIFGADHQRLQVTRNVPSLLAAVGLAHDLGNPPFGHQGEVAIQQYFSGQKLKEKTEVDFLKFDGNAQTFRLLTRLQYLKHEYGLNLTLGTLAALVKYPSIYGSKDMGGFKKFGVFASEKDVIEDVWEHTGLGHGVRHPLAYVMEACDDIAYSVIDAEDTVKKGCASFYDLVDFLESTDGADPVIKQVVDFSRGENKEFRKGTLSSRELNDLSMQMFRVKAIALMVDAATDAFVGSVSMMMNGSLGAEFELIKSSKCAQFCWAVKEFDKRYGFQHKEVLRLELEGNCYIKKMMQVLESAIEKDGSRDFPFERFVFLGISENYRRVYGESLKDGYARRQLLCDAVSGMTESYLVKQCKEYGDLKNASP